MDETVEKSCWGVTLWAIAIVMIAAIVLSFIVGGSETVVTGSSAVISS